ncbi:Protein NHR-36 [Aphelenchoides avenae]|nr:Protein NHR-36 [Aphelenchus avenae]
MDTKLLEHLLYLESKSRRLRESTFDPQEMYWADIREILSGHYHLSDAGKYEKPPNWPMSIAELIVKSPSTGVAGICHSPDLHTSHLQHVSRGAEQKRPLGCTHYPTLDLILSIEVAKTMPVFQKLDEADQRALLRHVALVNATITEAFYTLEHHADTITVPNGLQPMAMRQRRRWSTLDVSPVQPLEYDVFCRVLDPLKRIGLTTEEYVLLKALIYCLGVTCLSSNARTTQRRASQKYSKILLRRMQSNLGEAAGAKKYAEALSLVDAFLHFTQKIRQFYLLMFAAEPQREPSSILGWATRV